MLLGRLVSTSSEVLCHRICPNVGICVRIEGAFLAAKMLDSHKQLLTGVLRCAGAHGLQQNTKADITH